MPEVHNFPTSCKSTKKTGSVGDILKKIIAIVRDTKDSRIILLLPHYPKVLEEYPILR
jgi:hypothetical protein